MSLRLNNSPLHPMQTYIVWGLYLKIIETPFIFWGGQGLSKPLGLCAGAPSGLWRAHGSRATVSAKRVSSDKNETALSALLIYPFSVRLTGTFGSLLFSLSLIFASFSARQNMAVAWTNGSASAFRTW